MRYQQREGRHERKRGLKEESERKCRRRKWVTESGKVHGRLTQLQEEAPGLT